MRRGVGQIAYDIRIFATTILGLCIYYTVLTIGSIVKFTRFRR